MLRSFLGAAWKSAVSGMSITVGGMSLGSVSVASCLGWQPICSARLPVPDCAAGSLRGGMLLPMPPLPSVAETLAGSLQDTVWGLRLRKAGASEHPSDAVIRMGVKTRMLPAPGIAGG